MADETRIIQINTGTTAQWNSQVRAMKIGEFGYNKETKEVKIGDGTSPFASLKAFLTGENALSQLAAVINAANGLAGLDSSGKIPEAKLPADTGKFFVGELYFQLVIRAGFVWANGQTLSGVSTKYPKLVAWLKDSSSSGGAWLRKSLAEWNAEWNDAKWNAPDTGSNAVRAGMSPYYVLDESANTIKVPDLRGAYQVAAGFDNQTSGTVVVDGIRRIAAGFGCLGTMVVDSTGAVTIDKRDSDTSSAFVSGNSLLAWLWFLFNSERIAPIALTNRPRSIAGYLCLYAGTA